MEDVLVFTDGGCSGNPGPGGWAYVIIADGSTRERWGAEGLTTNNRMELSAVIAALKSIVEDPSLRGRPLTVYTDSQYVQKGISSWVSSWKRNGWRTASKDPVKNRELWQELDSLAAGLTVAWRWVKGHAGNEYNERCDALTQEAIASVRDQR